MTKRSDGSGRCAGGCCWCPRPRRHSSRSCAGMAPLTAPPPRPLLAAAAPAEEEANITPRISTGLIELAPDHVVSTTLYNDQFPGPLLRPQQGRRVVDIQR